MMNREIPKALRNAFIVHFWADMLFAVPLMIAPIGLLELMGWDVVDPLTARVVAAALFGIGSESLLGRNGDFDHFRGMLRLKVIWSSAGIEADDLKDVIEEFDGLIVRSRTKPDAALITAAKRLKVIGRAGVGVDNIDLEAAKAAGVAVVNTPSSTSLAVAEHTFALMLSAIKNITKADRAMKSGTWPKKELNGSELAGKTLGIVGIGNIGALVAERAAAFGMQVIAYDPFLKEDVIQQRGAQPSSLEDLYQLVDIITFHLPLTEQTRSMVNADSFSTMKPGVVLLHAARGGVIDESALLVALNSGKVSAAGLDVFETEPPGANELVQHPNVVATPHIAAQTAEAQVRAAVDVAEEVANVLLKKEIRWRVA